MKNFKPAKNTYDRKEQRRQYHLMLRSRRESYILKKTGGTCELCKEHWPSDILCFHHLNSEDKEFQLETKNWNNNKLNKALEEAEKCAILCMNCHALEHKALSRGETLLNDKEAYSRYRNKRFSGEPSVDDRNERPSDTEQEGICIPF